MNYYSPKKMSDISLYKLSQMNDENESYNEIFECVMQNLTNDEDMSMLMVYAIINCNYNLVKTLIHYDKYDVDCVFNVNGINMNILGYINKQEKTEQYEKIRKLLIENGYYYWNVVVTLGNVRLPLWETFKGLSIICNGWLIVLT